MGRFNLKLYNCSFYKSRVDAAKLNSVYKVGTHLNQVSKSLIQYCQERIKDIRPGPTFGWQEKKVYTKNPSITRWNNVIKFSFLLYIHASDPLIALSGFKLRFRQTWKTNECNLWIASVAAHVCPVVCCYNHHNFKAFLQIFSPVLWNWKGLYECKCLPVCLLVCPWH